MEGRKVNSQNVRAIIQDIYDKEHNLILDKPVGRYYLVRESEVRSKCEKLFAELILMTDFVSLSSKLYFINSNLSAKEIAIKMLRDNKIDISVPLIFKRLREDIEKINELLGGSFFVNLTIGLEDDSDGIIVEYCRKITETINKYRHLTIESLCALNLDCSRYYYELSDKEFDNFVKVIKHYTKKAMNRERNKLSEEAIGYVNYLFSSSLSNKTDIDRLNKLKALILE